MTTATFYPCTLADTALPNSGRLLTATGGSNVAQGIKVGQLTGYGQWTYAGNSTLFTPGSTLPTVANGNGWLLDASILNLKGNQISSSATWTIVFNGQMSVGTVTVNNYFVLYVYNTISQNYTYLGTLTKSGASWSTSNSNHTIAATTISGFPTMLNFGNGDTLYIELWFDITNNSSGSNNASLQLELSFGSPQGSTTASNITLSNYQAIPTPKNTGGGFYRSRRFHRERQAA